MSVVDPAAGLTLTLEAPDPQLNLLLCRDTRTGASADSPGDARVACSKDGQTYGFWGICELAVTQLTDLEAELPMWPCWLADQTHPDSVINAPQTGPLVPDEPPPVDIATDDTMWAEAVQRSCAVAEATEPEPSRRTGAPRRGGGRPCPPRR